MKNWVIKTLTIFAAVAMLSTVSLANIKHKKHHATLQTTSSVKQTDITSQAQQMLKDKGIYKGEVNGKLDKKTCDALGITSTTNKK